MAHKKAGGSTKNGRDSNSKRLGVKIFGGQVVAKGQIILRQNGTKFHSGDNTNLGGDYTVYSLVDGLVLFTKKKVRDFTGNLKLKTFVSVTPSKE
jgi:large subunit ribosomal protein L27